MKTLIQLLKEINEPVPEDKIPKKFKSFLHRIHYGPVVEIPDLEDMGGHMLECRELYGLDSKKFIDFLISAELFEFASQLILLPLLGIKFDKIYFHLLTGASSIGTDNLMFLIKSKEGMLQFISDGNYAFSDKLGNLSDLCESEEMKLAISNNIKSKLLKNNIKCDAIAVKIYDFSRIKIEIHPHETAEENVYDIWDNMLLIGKYIIEDFEKLKLCTNFEKDWWLAYCTSGVTPYIRISTNENLPNIEQEILE